MIVEATKEELIAISKMLDMAISHAAEYYEGFDRICDLVDEFLIRAECDNC